MASQVRIYRQAKTPTQSGRAHTNQWIVEFEPETARRVEPLMGWTSSGDMRGQVRLRFDSQEEAVAYARRRGLMYTLEPPRERRIRPKSYAENFRHDRFGLWTH